MHRASVPETPIDEHGDLHTHEHKIWPGSVDPPMEAVAEAFAPEPLAEPLLWCGVLSPDSGHLLGTGQWRPGFLAHAPSRSLKVCSFRQNRESA